MKFSFIQKTSLQFQLRVSERMENFQNPAKMTDVALGPKISSRTPIPDFEES